MSEIRPARSSGDLEAARALFREYQAWVAEPCCFAGFERELAELPGEYGPPGGLLLLALEDGGTAHQPAAPLCAGWRTARPK